jgi:hypothetical protein
MFITVIIVLSIALYIMSLPSFNGIGHYQGKIVKKYDNDMNDFCFDIIPDHHHPDQIITIGVYEKDYNKYNVGDYFNGTARVGGWGWI